MVSEKKIFEVFPVITVFTKSAGLPDKTGIFSFCPAKTSSLSDKCPVNLSKENNILTTNMPSVLQKLICCPVKDYGLSDSCPALVVKISLRLLSVGTPGHDQFEPRA